MPVFPVKQLPDPRGRFIFENSARDHFKVLRLKPGEDVVVSFPDGRQARAKIIDTPQGWEGQVEDWQDSVAKESSKIWLACGLIKFRRLEWLIEKATELGLWRLTPLYLQYSRYQKDRPISAARLERLERLAQETLKQCERPLGPWITPPMVLEQWLQEVADLEGQKVYLGTRDPHPPLTQFSWPRQAPHALALGCEGGFSPEEIELLEKKGFQAASLGRSILKTETAAVTALALLQNQMEFL